MALLRGTVTDNQDPMQRGRCRVFVWGMHHSEDPNLPWAETAGSTMFGLHKGVGYSGVLQVGTTVWVDFEQADIQCPVITGVFVGHDAENAGEVSPENSDFHPDAKGDNYGKVWMFNTPAGNSFKMDDNSPRVHITTPNGFELDLDDANRKIRLGTPCGPELVMECDGKLTLTSGCSKIVMDGCKMSLESDQLNIKANQTVIDSNVQLNGHLTAQGVFAPNLCTCSSPGDPYAGGPPGKVSSKEQKEKEAKQKCEPQKDQNGKNDCSNSFPPENDEKSLEKDMQDLLAKAKEIYKKKTSKDLNVCETKMKPERYQCLKSAGEEPPVQMVCGLGVVVSSEPCEETPETKLAEEDDLQPTSAPPAGCNPKATTNIKRAMNKIYEAERHPEFKYLGPKIADLTMDQSFALAKILSASESSFRPHITEGGFIGEFMMGAPALHSVGLITDKAWRYGVNKKGEKTKYIPNNAWKNPENWAPGMSLEKFLGDRALQHRTLAKLIEKNIGYAKNAGGKLGPAIRAAYARRATGGCNTVGTLTAMHLLGYGGGLLGLDGHPYYQKDGNGVTAQSYYEMGKTACQRWSKC